MTEADFFPLHPHPVHKSESHFAFLHCALDSFTTIRSFGETDDHHVVSKLETIQMAYGEHVVYRNLELTVERGERTVLVGPNGAGKSTLPKILAGVVEFQKGTRSEGLNAKIGYFSQHRAATLDPSKSILQEVMDVGGVSLSENEARGILGSFLFKKDDIFKKTSVLSGGEKTRLNLIKFLVDPPNLLLMD